MIVESRPIDTVTTEIDFASQGKAISRSSRLAFESVVGNGYERNLAGLKAIAEDLPKEDFAGLEAETVTASPVPVAYVEAASGKDETEFGAIIARAYGRVGTFMRVNRLRQACSPAKIKDSYGGEALKVVRGRFCRGMRANYDKIRACAAAHGYEQAGAPWDECAGGPETTPAQDLTTSVYLPMK